MRSFAVDASTNTWTYMIQASLRAGNSVTETFTITLTPTDTNITAETETIKIEYGQDANGYYYILDDGARVKSRHNPHLPYPPSQAHSKRWLMNSPQQRTTSS